MEQSKKIKASIIIRAYNVDATLARAIESALAQEYARDAYEIIIIDDGSTDKTAAMADSFSGRCRVIHQENQGAVKAANRGFHESRAEYVTLLDADDEFHPHLLAKAIAVLDADPSTDFAYADYDEEYQGVQKHVIVDDLFKTLACGVLYRKTSLDKAGGYRDKLLFPEYDLLLSTLGFWRGVYIPEPLFIYHRSLGSLSASGQAATGIAELTRLHPDKITFIQGIRSYTLE